jgi:hypothetical protein
MAVRIKKGKKAKQDPSTSPVKESSSVSSPVTGKNTFFIELIRTKTFVRGDETYLLGEVYQVDANKRQLLLKLTNDWDVPYFRDVIPGRKKKIAEAERMEPSGDSENEDEEIDTAVKRPQGVTRLPKGMRRTDSGGVVV